MMDVPSMPIHLVTITSSPTRAPPVVIKRSFFALPTPVTEMTGWLTTAVTSVCPPITCICSFSQAHSTSCISLRIRGSSAEGGSKTVRRTPTGSAPALARSLAVICSASVPISFSVPVMGSVESTNTSSGASCMTAQSSPTPAPTSTSSLFV